MTEEEDRMIRLVAEITVALDRAKVPAKARGHGVLEFVGLVGKKSINREISDFVWDHLGWWEREFLFIVGGDRGDDPAERRRQVGQVLLCNGIIHAVQRMLTPLDLPGRYIDFQNLLTVFSDRLSAKEAIDELGACRYLFISEIYADPEMPETRQRVISSMLDDLFRRRIDSSLVSILSFRQDCGYVRSYGRLGNELAAILQDYADLPSVLDMGSRVCKIKMLPVDKKGLPENGSANA